jgi:hypothetical protein
MFLPAADFSKNKCAALSTSKQEARFLEKECEILDAGSSLSEFLKTDSAWLCMPVDIMNKVDRTTAELNQNYKNCETRLDSLDIKLINETRLNQNLVELNKSLLDQQKEAAGKNYISRKQAEADLNQAKEQTQHWKQMSLWQLPGFLIFFVLGFAIGSGQLP